MIQTVTPGLDVVGLNRRVHALLDQAPLRPPPPLRPLPHAAVLPVLREHMQAYAAVPVMARLPWPVRSMARAAYRLLLAPFRRLCRPQEEFDRQVVAELEALRAQVEVLQQRLARSLV